MTPYTLRYFTLLFSVPLLMSCGDNKTTENDSSISSVAKDIFGGKELPQATTDSTFVQSYISDKPAFKEHKEYMALFYGDRNYELAWFRDNDLVPETEKFLSVIDKASAEGLNPENYKIVDLQSMIEKYRGLDGQDSARLDLQREIDVALTASYFNYASDFYRGRVNPQLKGSADWNVKKNKVKLHKTLQTILRERESTYPYYEFEALHAGYTRLRDKLQEYRALEQKGGWPKIELGNRKVLEKGDTAQAVLALRKRLNPGSTINASDPKAKVYDAKLQEQVKEFQMLHGLDQDGVVGGNTLAELNIPVQDRIRQIMINMERWRWIPKRMVPKSLDQKYIWVNIPEYKLYIYEDPDNDPEAERAYEKVMEMRVIVGKTLNSTPIFSDKLEYVVMSPYWNVPNSIVQNEIKPKMVRNPGWLASQNMEVVTRDREPRTVSPYSIDWANVSANNFSYRIRQKPGPKNSLGMIKFLFPNQYSVYLHDTPADALFQQTERDFSHGCVRLERPADLGAYLLQDMPEWNKSKIEQTMRSGEETWVTLPKKVQVYLVYFTSWVDEQGRIHFRDDIYGHDKQLEQEYFG